MEKEILKEPQFTDEIVSIIRSVCRMKKLLRNYMTTMIMILQEV